MKLFFLFSILCATLCITMQAQLSLPIKIVEGNCIHSIIAHKDTLWGIQSLRSGDSYAYSTDGALSWVTVGWAGSVMVWGKTSDGRDTIYDINQRITALVFHDDELFVARSMVWTGSVTVHEPGGLYGSYSGKIEGTVGDIYSLFWQDNVLIYFLQDSDIAGVFFKYSSDNGRTFRSTPPQIPSNFFTASGVARIGDITFYFSPVYQDSLLAKRENNIVFVVQGASVTKIPTNRSFRYSYGQAFTSYKHHLLYINGDSLFTSPDSAKTWYHIPTPQGFKPHTVAVINDTLYIAPPRNYNCTIVSVQEELSRKQNPLLVFDDSGIVLQGFENNRPIEKVEIFDMLGRSIYTSASAYQGNTGYLSLAPAQIPSGIYTVVLHTSAQKQINVPFVKY